MKNFLPFLRRLKESKISYSLDHCRENAVMVEVDAPGEHWEIEFLDDGTVEVEVFKSDGKILGEEALKELFARFAD